MHWQNQSFKKRNPITNLTQRKNRFVVHRLLQIHESVAPAIPVRRQTEPTHPRPHLRPVGKQLGHHAARRHPHAAVGLLQRETTHRTATAVARLWRLV